MYIDFSGIPGIHRIELENHYFTAIMVITEPGKNNQWLLKLMNVWWGTGYVHSLKLSLQFINF